jgi:hypothetical protein
MKRITFKDIDGVKKTIEVGKRLHELSGTISDIIVDGDEFIVLEGSMFTVYRGHPFEYEELHATQTPYQFKGRPKSI